MVSISNATEFGQVNTDFFKEYEEKESLELFQKARTTAVKNEGIVDMASPEFDLRVVDTDGKKQDYHLWLGEVGQNSGIMDVNDTHTLYYISEDFTEQLIALIRE